MHTIEFGLFNQKLVLGVLVINACYYKALIILDHQAQSFKELWVLPTPP